MKTKNQHTFTATVTGPPLPTSPAPLERDHQRCHRPSTTAARSTPQLASQLPKKIKPNTSSPVTTSKQSIKNLLDTQPQIGTSQCVTFCPYFDYHN